MSAVHPPETIATLAELAKEKLSASQIGAILGKTRNVIVGLAFRNHIKLTGRPVAKAKTRKTAMEKQMECEAIAELSEGISFDELEPDSCRYPFGTGPIMFCGRKAHGPFPYCKSHCALTYRVRER